MIDKYQKTSLAITFLQVDNIFLLLHSNPADINQFRKIIYFEISLALY